MKCKPIREIRESAFSLIEEVLALGIVSFALVSLLGLIPVGLASFRTSFNVTVESQIAQSLTLKAFSSYGEVTTGKIYFNDQGVEVPEKNPDQIYTAFMTRQAMEVPPSSLSSDSASCIIINISSKTTPKTTNSYPVMVARNH